MGDGETSSEDGSTEGRDAFTYANSPSASISTEWISNTAMEIDVQVCSSFLCLSIKSRIRYDSYDCDYSKSMHYIYFSGCKGRSLGGYWWSRRRACSTGWWRRTSRSKLCTYHSIACTVTLTLTLNPFASHADITHDTTTFHLIPLPLMM